MSHPQSAEEYVKRFAENEKVTGFGIEGVTVHMPCPFCAAPDFITYKVLDVQQALMNGATCKECGRGAAAIFQTSANGTSFEIVQTGGPDQPEWLEPKMRRVENN